MNKSNHLLQKKSGSPQERGPADARESHNQMNHIGEIPMKMKTLVPFLALSFGLTWGIAAILIFFYDQVV
ncbi:MAG: hypothetical protein PVH65_05215, partial [Chloroflexota bacterium]